MTSSKQSFIEKHIKRITFGLMISVVLIVLSEMVPRSFERYMPFEHYVDIKSITVSDIIVGDKYQSGTIVRQVNGQEGYAMEVIAELQLVGIDEATGDTKVYYRTENQFLEVRNSEILNFREEIPTDIAPGNYYWVYGYTLKVNANISKVKAIKTNTFKVKRISDLINQNDVIEGVKVNIDSAKEVNVNLENPDVTTTSTSTESTDTTPSNIK